MSVLVFVESANGKVTKAGFEAVYYGSKIGSPVVALAFGDLPSASLAELGNYGATKVVVARNIKIDDSQALTKFVVAQAQEVSAQTIVFSHDSIGKAVAPRVSVRLKAGLVAGAIALPEGNSIRKNAFSGKAFAEYEINTPVKVIAVLPNSVKPEKSGNTAEVVENTADFGAARVVSKEIKKDSGDHVPLPEAEVVVSAGRGLKGPENWGMIEELANELGAATACSRPVADIGWRPHHEHVGQTGVAIRPNLYFAIGISGAIQHLAGVNGSKVMVAINTDPEAPFFKAADYGVVGDAFQVVPKLIEAVKKFKAANH
ncbi:MAG: electron transfer flavoprotein subunit alpha/FixB family protein [Bacteroidota bacterium]